MINGFQVVYLLSTFIQVYAIYRFLSGFHRSEDRVVAYEWLGYVIYYLVITSVFLSFQQPLLTVTTNIVFLLIISKRYTEDLRKAISGMVYIYIILMLVELLVGMAIAPHMINGINMNDELSSSVAVIVINLCNYMVVIALSRLMTETNKGHIPLSYWVSLIIIPVTSMYIIFSLIRVEGIQSYQYVFISSLLLIANFMVFYIYESLGKYYEIRLRESSLQLLNQRYKNQFEMIAKTEHELRAFSHDFNRHMAVLSAMAAEVDHPQLEAYLATLLETYNDRLSIVKTGNVVIDSIVNYELAGFSEKGISLKLKSGHLPPEMLIADSDMTIILSNLLNNAVTGTETSQEEKVIDIDIRYDKGVLFIHVSNTFDGITKYREGLIRTRKTNEANHGMGLANVRQTIEKYNGSMRVYHNERTFNVEAVIYVKS